MAILAGCSDKPRYAAPVPYAQGEVKPAEPPLEGSTNCGEIDQARAANDPKLPTLYRLAVQQGLTCPNGAVVASLEEGKVNGDLAGQPGPPKTANQQRLVKAVPGYLRAACLALVRAMALDDAAGMRDALTRMREPAPDQFIAETSVRGLLKRYRPFAEPVELPIAINGTTLFPGGRLVGARKMTVRCALETADATSFRFRGLSTDVE